MELVFPAGMAICFWRLGTTWTNSDQNGTHSEVYYWLQHQEKTAIFFIPKKVWNRPIKVWKTIVFQENFYFIPQNAFYNFVEKFHTFFSFFIPWVSISYLGHHFHTLFSFGIFSYLRHHFHTFECEFFIPLSVNFSYLWDAIFHIFGMQFHNKNCEFHTLL